MTLQKLCSAMTVAVALNFAVAQADDLTTLPWLVNAVDLAERPWSNSYLVFTEQVPEGDGFKLSGYFDWFLSGIPQGRELVRGTMNSTGAIDLAGYELINPGAIILDVYRARLSQDGKSIVNGTFGVPQGVSGVWSAKQAVTVTAQLTPPDKLDLCWSTATNAWYQVQTRVNPALEAWVPVSDAWTPGTGNSECLQLTIPAGADQRFYRVAMTNQTPAL